MTSFLHFILLMKTGATKIVTSQPLLCVLAGEALLSQGGAVSSGRSSEPKLREGRGRINIFCIRTVALPFIHRLPLIQYGARLDGLPYMTENKSYRCRNDMGVLLTGSVLLWLFKGCKRLKNKYCHWLGSLNSAFLNVFWSLCLL